MNTIEMEKHYKQIKPMLFSMAKRLSQTMNGDFEEAVSLLNLFFVEKCQTYNPECSTKFSTYFYYASKLWINHKSKLAQKEAPKICNQDYEFYSMFLYTEKTTEETVLTNIMLENTIKNMSPLAQIIIDLVLKKKTTKKTTKKSLKKELHKKMKLTYSKIENAFTEIKTGLELIRS